MIGVSNKPILAFICCLLLGTAEYIAAKAWRGIVPLRSKRADVRRVLGKPLIGGVGPTELYEKEEGRIQVMYARRPCEQGLPADWGNWKVQRDTVVNISITLKEELKVADRLCLKSRNPTNSSWWMVQIRPKKALSCLLLLIPPTAVGGYFRSSLVTPHTAELGGI